MIDECANPECSMPFDCRQGRFFRFRRECAVNNAPANAHSVYHLWLCGRCAGTYTLQYHKQCGVVIGPRLMDTPKKFLPRVIRAA
jgi:hypothetical protein